MKVTKTEPRDTDNYDTPIVYWQEAKLRYKSIARVAKTTLLHKDMFDFKVGDLHPDYLVEIQNQFMKFITETNI